MLHTNYPTAAAVDVWCEEMRKEAEALAITAQDVTESPVYTFPLRVRHQDNARYIAFSSATGDTFYGYWQPTQSTAPAPLLVHLPGYGAEMSAHPQLVAQGYNVLHINPLGYTTPTGFDTEKTVNGGWPVLPDTVTTAGARGYRQWLTQALSAVQWASGQQQVQADRIATFGTSQGGGTALLLGSLLVECGLKAVAADLPFLTNFPLVYGKSNRLTMPVLLTAGSIDEVTPKDSIIALFDRLPGTRSFTEFAGQGHAYTVPFLPLATAWFGLYV